MSSHQLPAEQNSPQPAQPMPVHLSGARVQLVPPDKALHLENYLRWFNDPEVNRFLLRFMPMTRMAEEAWFDSLPERAR